MNDKEEFRDIIQNKLNETFIDEEFEDLDDDSLIIDGFDNNRNK